MICMKKILLSLCLGLVGFGAVAAEEGPFAVDGNRITVTTDRYRVVLEDLCITEVENRLTGEVYAQPRAAVSPSTPASRELFGSVGVRVERVGKSLEQLASQEEAADNAKLEALQNATESTVVSGQKNKKPDPNTLVKALEGKTRQTVERVDNGLLLTYTGLYAEKESEPEMVLRLRLKVDPENGDLCITPEVKGNIQEVNGVRDRGVRASVLQLRNLVDGMDLVLPVDNGCHFNRDNAGAKIASEKIFSVRWPQSWQAGIFIADGEKGCLAMWADEPELKYSRTLSVARDSEQWHTGFAFTTLDQIWKCDEIKGATWRFNVFKGYWARAAEHYRKQCEKQWPDFRPIEQRKPEWAGKARVAVLETNIKSAERIMKLLPPDSHVVCFMPQCWLLGWNDGSTRKIYGEMDGIFPNGPDQRNPVRYESVPNFFPPEQLAAAQKAGLHIFPYTNTCLVLGSHPWKKEKLGWRSDFSWKLWGLMYADLIDDVVKRYGTDGIYEDCSWVGTGGLFGTPDGMSGNRGTVEMRRYFRSLHPNIPTMGERRQEDTALGQDFALQISGWGASMAHPILGCLQEPYCRVYDFVSKASHMDSNDIQGMLMTLWPNSVYNGTAMQEDRMLLRRGQIFTQEQLVNYFPEVWEKNVLHYFMSKDGMEYRVERRDGGVRLVKMAPEGPQTQYLRLSGVSSAPSGGTGVEGWLGYDGDRFIGLNPKASYAALPDIGRPKVTISSLPEGVYLKSCTVREGYWVTLFASTVPPGKGAKQPVEPVEIKLQVKAEGVVPRFAGARSVKKLGEGVYEVNASLPGGLGAYWTEPVEPVMNAALGGIPALNTIHRRDTGLAVSAGAPVRGTSFNPSAGKIIQNEEGRVLWLLRVPVDANWFLFKCGAQAANGDGCNYMVRINGKQVWKEHCPSNLGEDSKGEVLRAPQKEGAVDLRPYQDQAIVLELAIDGYHSEISETTLWTFPRFSDQEEEPGALQQAPQSKGGRGKKKGSTIKPSLSIDDLE